MKYDVDKALDAHRRRKATDRHDTTVRGLVDIDGERRLLASMLADDKFCDCCELPELSVMDLCDEVEVDDFTDYRHTNAFTAIRSLVELGQPVSVAAVSDEVERRNGVGSNAAMSCSIVWLASLLVDQKKHSVNSLRAAQQHLRELAIARRQA